MAGKARRAAARQGQLSRRRKKGQRGPLGVPTTPLTADQPEYDNGVSAAEGPVAAAVPPNGPATLATATPPPAVARPEPGPRTSRTETAPRGPARMRGARPAAYNYVGSELRRIGVLSVSVIGVLVALAFVL